MTGGSFSFSQFVSMADPVIKVIGGVATFIALIVIGFGVLTTKGKSDERTDFLRSCKMKL